MGMAGGPQSGGYGASQVQSYYQSQGESYRTIKL